jgi:hypothetical protein
MVESTRCAVREASWMFMQDAGGKEDAELSEDDVILGWREWLVESFGHCQPIGLRRRFTNFFLPCSYSPRFFSFE